MRGSGRPERREAGAVRGASLIAAGLLMVGTGLMPGVGAAQEPAAGAPGDPPVLTLQEAVERAARHNPSFRRTTNQLALNVVERREAWLSLLPTPSVNLLSTNRSWNRTFVGTDNLGNPIDNPDAETVQFSSSSHSGGLFFQLDFTRFVELRQRDTQAELRELDVETESLALRGEVIGAFLDAQEEQIAVELEEELLVAAQRNLEAVQRLHRLAQRDRTDLLSAELDVAEREAEMERRRADLRIAFLALRNVIGDTELEEFELDPAPVGIFDPAVLDEEALVDEALRSSPLIRRGEAQLRVQERNRTRNRAQWLPTLNANLTTGWSRQVQGGDAFLDPFPGGDRDQRIILSLSFPDLGQYFSRNLDSRRTEVEIRDQEETLRETRGDVEQEVRSLLVELRSSHRGLALQERRAALAEENLALTLDAYRLGRRTFLELQTASEQAAQARRGALQSRFDFERSRVNLERALGIPLDRFLPGPGDGGPAAGG